MLVYALASSPQRSFSLIFLRPHVTSFSLFFFNDTATTEIYTLSLHDALPIYCRGLGPFPSVRLRMNWTEFSTPQRRRVTSLDRKSTRLNSSHGYISYAVFCLKKKKKQPL